MKTLLKTIVSCVFLTGVLSGLTHAKEQINLQMADESVSFPEVKKSYLDGQTMSKITLEMRKEISIQNTSKEKEEYMLG